ncbi:MAG: biotin--[acetyl-CoA-carboxylase] ligase [Raoultibacter sp.]|jgi:BirA family biotin operon repressor/biotin-[acetyl-CoA-carboxylase] ligase
MSIAWLESVESTNTEIKKAIAAGKPEKTAVASFQQTGGYGRQGRGWSSPVGGLYLSLLMRPFDHGVSSEAVSTLALAMSIALKRMLASLGVKKDIGIKWPNDILLKEGKLAGVSVELVDGAVCVGIGVNVFEPQETQDKSTKSAGQSKYHPVYLARYLQGEHFASVVSSGVLEPAQKECIQSIAGTLFHEVYSVYDQWLDGGFPSLRSEYQSCSYLDGRKVRLLSLTDDILSEGTVCDIDEQGRLVLRLDNGELAFASSGEVHLV